MEKWNLKGPKNANIMELTEQEKAVILRSFMKSKDQEPDKLDELVAGLYHVTDEK